MLRSFTILLLLLAAKTCCSQTYESEIIKAGNAYDKKNYDSCSFYFSKAFSLQTPAGPDLYNAAVCNILNGNTRQTFDLLFRAIRNGANISKLRIDPDFESLHRSSQWKRLLKKANKIQIDSFNTYQYPSYAAQLAELWEADQSIRFRLANAYKNNDTILANQLWQKMRRSDSIVLLKFQPILDNIGWPTRSKVGSRGAATAFLIIDHSPREVME
jgi:hypothetical protein